MHYVSRCWRFELLVKEVANSSNKFATCLTHTQFAIAGIMVSGSSSMMHVRAAAMVGAALVIYTLATIISLPSFATALILNSTSRGCSKHCESINCENPHHIRYGKFCGVGYTGCPNQSPCDRLDLCCKKHDLCVGTNYANFQNETCRSSFKDCVQQYLSTGAAVYHGSNCTGVIVQNTIMVALEGTTFRLAPGMAPQAGIDVPAGSPATSLNWMKAVSMSGLCAAAVTMVIHSCVRGLL